MMLVQTEWLPLAFVGAVVVAAAACGIVDTEVLESRVALPAVQVVVKVVVQVRSNRPSVAARWELGRVRPLID